MLRNDPSSISYWVSLIKAPPSKMQFSRIFTLFDSFEAKFKLAPEVKIYAD